jgi:hypothetical protein
MTRKTENDCRIEIRKNLEWEDRPLLLALVVRNRLCSSRYCYSIVGWLVGWLVDTDECIVAIVLIRWFPPQNCVHQRKENNESASPRLPY